MLVSLPASWVKKYGIKKGEEVEVEERGREILISSGKSFAIEKFQFNTSGLHPLIRRTLLRAYLEGYDEIEIRFDKKEHFNLIHSLVNNELIGFEIIKQEKNSCLIKDVAPVSDTEFNSVFRRIFLMIKSMGEESLEAIKRRDKKELEEIAKKDFEINRFTNFCIRLLNKKGCGDFKKVLTYLIILQQLEKIADEYKYIIQEILKTSLNVEKNVLGLYNQVNRFFNVCYEFHYNLNKEKAVSTALDYESLKKDLEENLKTKNVNSLKVISHLKMIHSYSIEILGSQLVYIKDL